MLTVKDLTIGFTEGTEEKTVVKNSSFRLQPGESLGIVGESGSGKTITALSVLQLLPPGMKIRAGSIIFENPEGKSVDLTRLNEKQMRVYRGGKLSMIFQEPMTSLNPSMRSGEQILEAAALSMGQEKVRTGEKRKAEKKVQELLREVHLPDEPGFYRKFPHELSGGQRQRIMIAMALAGDPDLLIADEPTTALDVTVQKKILELLKEIQQTRGMGMLFISHDLGVIRAICEKALVMYRGEIVESGKVEDLFNNPRHPYTKGLIACRPVPGESPIRLPILADFMEDPSISGSPDPENKSPHKGDKAAMPENQTPRKNNVTRDPENSPSARENKPALLLEVKNVHVRYTMKKNLLGRPVQKFHAVKNLSFCINEGETLGLIGESGCGKSSLGRSIIRLVQSPEGEILYRGKNILSFRGRELTDFRKKVQFIFQDPYSSLNPKIAAGPAIMEVMKIHGMEPDRKKRKERVLELLGKVGLEPGHFSHYPHEFSGGQRQRIGLARALATGPELIICDESVSSLDVSVQAMILNLLNDLKETFNLTYLFISHDLSVVRYMSDRILVMKDGAVVEYGDGEVIFSNPGSEHTKELINSILD